MDSALARGQILKLDDFKSRAGLGRIAWMSLRRQAIDAGTPICHRVGKITLVDVDKFLAYLESRDAAEVAR